MSACRTASGAVFFIADKVSTKAQPVSYEAFLAEEHRAPESLFFGKRPASTPIVQEPQTKRA